MSALDRVTHGTCACGSKITTRYDANGRSLVCERGTQTPHSCSERGGQRVGNRTLDKK